MKALFNLEHLKWTIFGLGFLLNLILWALVFLFFPTNMPAAVLHYSIGVGIDFIGEGYQIIMLPMAGLALLLVNMGFGTMVAKASKQAAWVFFAAIPIIQCILLLAFFLLWRFNS